MSAGKNHSKQTAQGTSTQSLDPQIRNSLLGNYANAQNLAANTPTDYNGQLVAGFNPNQTAGQDALVNLANSGVGNAELGQATAAAGQVAGFNPQQVQAGQLSNTDLSPYMNPYTKDVTNTTLNDLDRSRQIANVGNDAQATQAGAFGGDRSAVLNSLTNGEYSRTAASTLAGLNQANYSQAQSAAQGDIAGRLSAAQGNQNAGIQGAGLNLNAANSLAAMSGQKLGQSTALANMLNQVGATQQGYAQNVLDASRNQFQTNLGNKMSMQQLINQALGLAGNPVLGTSQNTSSGKSSGWNLGFSSGGGGGGGAPSPSAASGGS